MDYVGKKVIHKAKFGEGTVVAQSGNSISVKFNSVPELKRFIVPDCFKTFLRFTEENKEAASALDREFARKQAEEAAIRKAEEEKALIAKKKKDWEKAQQNSQTAVPVYSSAEEFFDAQEKALIAEILYLKNNGGKRLKIMDGKLVDRNHGQFVYTFETESELNLPDNTQITIWNKEGGTTALVLYCEEFTLTIACLDWLGDTVPGVEISAEPWRLLNFLIDRLKTLRERPTPIVNSLVSDGWGKVRFNQPLMKGQETALTLSFKQPLTFVWGPPGTGKTHTLATIANAHMAKGYRVLMVSYSNISVDGAIKKVFDLSKSKAPGRMVRYGYPRDHELLEHDYLTTYNLVLRQNPELLQERSALIQERHRVSRTSPRYVEIGKRLAAIRRQLSEAEKKSVSGAMFVATTVSKAFADKTLYEDHFDTVIFDEASMAYIPQVVFAAGLAGKHFICLGDFSQLPPIVQSDKDSCLNVDIFQHCGIVQAVERGCGHEWLCMLDEQRRMHPEIADFASRTMYHGLMRSRLESLKDRDRMAGNAPFPGRPVAMADLSGMMTVCSKTADGSRINVLSALITMGMAVNAAQKCDVGVITPYNAQSRLLHAVARDVAKQHPELGEITCATVHQFQGSEKNVILYDAVDCFRMPYPGMLLTSMTNNYANRLFNVALTRARGKAVAVVNRNYMVSKKLSQNLIFREFIDEFNKTSVTGPSIAKEMENPLMRISLGRELDDAFLDDISKARVEVRIDIPGGATGSPSWYTRMSDALSSAKDRGVKVYVRVEDRNTVPSQLKRFAVENKYISNPVALIDKDIVWFGEPGSTANFISEGSTIPTRYRPVIRYQGENFRRALYGFLEMNRTVDTVSADEAKSEDGTYQSFAAYVAGEVRCKKCGSPMQLKKGKTGKFYMSCSAYPQCTETQFAEPELVDAYLYHGNKKGRHCPQDHTSLEAGIGKYGIYVRCNGIKKHYYKLDEI